MDSIPIADPCEDVVVVAGGTLLVAICVVVAVEPVFGVVVAGVVVEVVNVVVVFNISLAIGGNSN